jgi:hypothetical protein
LNQTRAHPGIARESKFQGPGISPVALANFAVSGSDIRGMIYQIELANQFRPQVILLSGRLNDLISYAPGGLQSSQHLELKPI